MTERIARVVVELFGRVQGVGYRPFVHRTAASLDLAGHVQNRGGHVVAEVEGDPDRLATFVELLSSTHPPGAKVLSRTVRWEPPLGARGLSVTPSTAHGGSGAFVAPDRATCEACERECDDPRDRRHGHAFAACSDCGPRMSAVERAPFERAATSLADFEPCDACRAEYENPGDRRFHCEMIACPRCGPTLTFVGAGGSTRQDALALAASALGRGDIGAIKGLGGYHLACDATDEHVVGRLRSRKGRDDKPFAVMVPDIETARALCHVSDDERALLVSPERPIVLLRRRASRGGVADAVAPGAPTLGLFLPYTPVHRLLCRAVGRPLVMTSGNTTEHAMVTTEADAEGRLRNIADFFLHHDRPIVVRVDDSVVRVGKSGPLMMRRARGYAPAPLPLVREAPRAVLAVGAELKGAFALASGDQVIVSHHLGDLDAPSCWEDYVRSVEHYEELAGVRPSCFARDLHDDFLSSRYADERAQSAGGAPVRVQHHVAHFAGCLAEHRHAGPALGVVWDGFGLGDDGAAWGCEFFAGDAAVTRRYAHLRYVPMPGGDKAARQGWRMAVSHLADAQVPREGLLESIDAGALSFTERCASRGLLSPPTSSAGRLFDAVASLTGLRHVSTYEGQAASELEWAAWSTSEARAYRVEIDGAYRPLQLDPRPMIRAIAADVRRGVPVPAIARGFHEALASTIVEVAGRARAELGLSTVALAGGVFMNALLLDLCIERLRERGFSPIHNALVPPNDGGICLGQAAVALARLHLS